MQKLDEKAPTQLQRTMEKLLLVAKHLSFQLFSNDEIQKPVHGTL